MAAKLEVNQVGLNALTAAELHRMMGEVDTTIEKYGGAEALNIVKPYNSFKAGYTDFSLAIKAMRGSVLTKDISDCDKECAVAYSAIKSGAKTAVKHFDPKVAKSGKVIKAVLDNYGDITEESLDEQMSLVERVLWDFDNKYVKDIENTGIGNWVERLKTLNEQMKKLNTERIGENAVKSTISLKVTRKNIEERYRNLCTVIMANVIVEGPEKYIDFIVNLNAANAKFESGNTKTISELEEPETPAVDYPDAKEWLEDLPFQGVENGDIYFILVDGKKVFYKLVDKQKFFWHPESEKAAGGWEKLN